VKWFLVMLVLVGCGAQNTQAPATSNEPTITMLVKFPCLPGSGRFFKDVPKSQISKIDSNLVSCPLSISGDVYTWDCYSCGTNCILAGIDMIACKYTPNFL